MTVRGDESPVLRKTFKWAINSAPRGFPKTWGKTRPGKKKG